MPLIRALVRLSRPHHWIKNLLLFAPAFFSGKIFSIEWLALLCVGFIAFCLVASAVYVMNDYFDREKDRLHPKKRFRPLASGTVSPRQALVLAGALLLLSIVACVFLPIEFSALLSVYFIANIVYSTWAKHAVILDVLAVALMYFLRVLGGAMIIHVEISAWIFITVFFGAVFLASGKRFAELRSTNLDKRPVLSEYIEDTVRMMFLVSMGASLLAYSLYTVDREGVYFYSIVLVTYSYFRYAHLVLAHGGGEEPESLLLHDTGIAVAGILWLTFSLGVYYLP